MKSGLCALALLCLAACSTQKPDGDSPPPRRAPPCDAFGCCTDTWGRNTCCYNSRDPFCDRYDPYWQERERNRDEERRRDADRQRERSLPLPPLPPTPGRKGLPKPF